jgi:hypothetical protein
MDDGLFALVCLLSMIASALVLWHRHKQAQAFRRLLKLLEEARKKKPDPHRVNDDAS